MTVVLDARTRGEVLDRAGRPDFDRWMGQVTGCGHCARPIRLRGRVVAQQPGGIRRVTYSTATEPDRVLLVRCGNRRASVCPSCSFEYAGDMWQLLHAGAAGGRKGVPESIRSHPLVFATLTAPGFGAVHTTRSDRAGTGSGRCRPARGAAQPCPHGRPTWCTVVHGEGDPRLGEPLCADCYDYDAHVAFNWHAPELWRRFTITLRRELAHHAGVSATEFTRACRVSFVKVAEFQRRGVVHFHALLRLDAPGDDFAPSTLPLDAHDLADVVRRAAAHVRLGVTMPDDTGLVLRFGQQIDTQTVNGGPVTLTPEHAARYIAKYATKSAEDFGVGDRRLTPAALPELGLSPHVQRLITTAWSLGGHEGFTGLRRWVHMLGFRGHFASKSRRYSTTLGAIRGERRAFRQRQAADRARELGVDEPEESTLVVGEWAFAGVGYLTGGDVALAVSAAARARQRRQAARDAT